MPCPRSTCEQHFHNSPIQSFDWQTPWHSLHTDIVTALQPPPFEYRFRLPYPALTIADGAAREGTAARGDFLAALSEQASLAPPSPSRSLSRGGLSGWQRNKVAEFIDDHLGEALRLLTLADLVGLSPYHFARAFKQSFGAPPHRYHLHRRIERAKALLANPENSVTDIARRLGFAETSSFSAAFRKATGYAPRDWRRTADAIDG